MVIRRGKFPFISSATGFHRIPCLAVDGVLTWHPKYNLMKLSVSVDIPDY